MIGLLSVPVVISVALGLLGPAAARRVGPRTATLAVPGLAVLAAAATGLSLSALACLLLARSPAVADAAQLATDALPWSCHALPAALGALPGVVVLGLVAGAGRVVWRTARTLQRTRRTLVGAALRPDGVRVVRDDRPRAVAVGGVRGVVVVSTGMIAVLSPAEQAAVLAHEHAHLRRRHHLSVLAVLLAAAADPLLRPLVGVVTDAVERDADETAARSVGRRQVAMALSRAALAASAVSRVERGAQVGLPAASGDTRRRVEALLAPAPSPDRPRVATVLGALLATALLSVWTIWGIGMSTDHHLDHAHAVWQHAGAQDAVSAASPAGFDGRGRRAAGTADPS